MKKKTQLFGKIESGVAGCIVSSITIIFTPQVSNFSTKVLNSKSAFLNLTKSKIH